VRDTSFGGGGGKKYNSGLEGSQAVPARPSGMGNVCRCRGGCQPYAPAAFYPKKIPGTDFC
jgi:hypothetical protein